MRSIQQSSYLYVRINSYTVCLGILFYPTIATIYNQKYKKSPPAYLNDISGNQVVHLLSAIIESTLVQAR